MGPWAEQLVIVRENLRFCPQPDKNKNDACIPFSSDMLLLQLLLLLSRFSCVQFCATP